MEYLLITFLVGFIVWGPLWQARSTEPPEPDR